jgi:hypothetical protein
MYINIRVKIQSCGNSVRVLFTVNFFKLFIIWDYIQTVVCRPWQRRVSSIRWGQGITSLDWLTTCLVASTVTERSWYSFLKCSHLWKRVVKRGKKTSVCNDRKSNGERKTRKHLRKQTQKHFCMWRPKSFLEPFEDDLLMWILELQQEGIPILTTKIRRSKN